MNESESGQTLLLEAGPKLGSYKHIQNLTVAETHVSWELKINQNYLETYLFIYVIVRIFRWMDGRMSKRKMAAPSKEHVF